MRIALISDSHTKVNIEFILDYLKKKTLSWKPDIIIINGDILGENEARENYGYNFNKALFYNSIDKDKLLKELAGENSEKLKAIAAVYPHGPHDDHTELEFSEHIKKYVEARYDYLADILARFSTIAPTYFNIGNYESPLHYNILKELAFLLDVDEQHIRKIALLSNYRETFKAFQAKLKEYDQKKLRYIGGSTFLAGDLLIAGIPGLNSSTIPIDSSSEFQEKITADMMSTVTRQLSYANKLLILNQCQGKLRKDPFAFRPASYSVRSFMEAIKGKVKQKIYVQSYHHFMTTHFYYASEFNFILNNAAVNNCLFNLIDIGNKVSCYDVDAKQDKLRLLKSYNYNLVDYSKPEERLALNYEDSAEVIKERNLDGCYYM